MGQKEFKARQGKAIKLKSQSQSQEFLQDLIKKEKKRERYNKIKKRKRKIMENKLETQSSGAIEIITNEVNVVIQIQQRQIEIERQRCFLTQQIRI